MYGYLHQWVRPALPIRRGNSLAAWDRNRIVAAMRRTPALARCVASPSPRRPPSPAHGPRRRPAVPIYNAVVRVPHLDVLAGDTVTWHNDSLRAHNVNADDGSFDVAAAADGRHVRPPLRHARHVAVLLPAAPDDARRRRRAPRAAERREGAAAPGQAVRAVRPRGAAGGRDGLDRGRRRASPRPPRSTRTARSPPPSRRARRRPTPRSPAASPRRPSRCSCSTAR